MNQLRFLISRFDEKDDKIIKYWKFMHLLNI